MTASNDRSETLREPKKYAKPALTEYGQLKDLTTGGSGNSKEGSSGQKPRP